MADYIYGNFFATQTREEEKKESTFQLQQYKNLISSLPKEEGWGFENNFYYYQSFWYPDVHFQAVLAVQDHFKAHSSDIIIASNPKSGATWMKALLFTVVTRDRYPIYNHPLLSENPHSLVPVLEINLYDNQIPDLEILPSPRLLATHIPYTSLPRNMIDSGCRIVYLCRNPKDVFVSMWHFKNKMRAGVAKPPLTAMEAFERFCNGVSHFGSFWDHALGYWRASLERPQHVLFMKYEELQTNPGFHLKRLAQFVGSPFTSEEEKEGLVDEILGLCSFENLSSLEVNKKTGLEESYIAAPIGNEAFFRKGKVGDWANYLTSEMIERLDQITEEKFHGYGLKL